MKVPWWSLVLSDFKRKVKTTHTSLTVRTMSYSDPSSAIPRSSALSLPVPPPKDPSEIYPLSAFAEVREALAETKTYPALSVPARMTALLRKKLSHVLLHRPQTKTIFADERDATRRVLLLSPKKQHSTISSAEEDAVFQDEQVASVLASDDNNNNNNMDCCTYCTHTVHYTYHDFTIDEVLQKILPVREVPSAFETVGSLVHVNLRPDVLPYKFWVGQVLLDKLQPRIRTVVHKLDSIDTQFRTFEMEVIAGDGSSEDWSQVTVKEGGCTFDLDFCKVYWNSRLAGEHRRLVQLIHKDAAQRQQQRTTVVADLMAGVGPFAIPLTAAKASKNISPVQVYANDLNPSSYKYLQINASKNKCQKNLHCYNMDARAFVRFLQKQQQQPNVGKNDGTPVDIDHVIMNLPASAPEFLDAFRGWSLPKLPRMHVHCFCRKSIQGYTDAAVRRCEKALGCAIGDDACDIHVVRDVSPAKNMLCVSFELPAAVRQLVAVENASIAATAQEEQPTSTTTTTSTTSDRDPEPKRARID